MTSLIKHHTKIFVLILTMVLLFSTVNIGVCFAEGESPQESPAPTGKAPRRKTLYQKRMLKS